MENLLTETIADLTSNNKKPSDVCWCGNEDSGWFSWDKFAELANKQYDAGYGSSEVFDNLKIVGKDWWLERREYDGSEWWVYKEYPKKPSNKICPETVFKDDYDDIL